MSRFEWRRNVPAVNAALVAFSLVASPFMVALFEKGRFTYGDVGKLVYAWFVNDVTKYAHWQGKAPGRGVPVHPDCRNPRTSRRIRVRHADRGTHPVWYDPTYWHEGLETHFDPKKQVRALIDAARVYWELSLSASAPLLAICVLLSLGSTKDLFQRLGRQWYLLGTGIVPFAMFAVLHTETRFVGAFSVMIFLGLLLAVRVPSLVRRSAPANAGTHGRSVARARFASGGTCRARAGHKPRRGEPRLRDRVGPSQDGSTRQRSCGHTGVGLRLLLGAFSHTCG